MTWEILGQALGILAFGVIATLTMSIVLPFIHDRYFPRKPG
jgi:hypothetical protein